MIAHLIGTVHSINTDNVILNVGGVGYLVFCPSTVLGGLTVGQKDVFLFTDYVVREDDVSIYGFTDAIQQSWFQVLGRVQGVGKKIAIGILSTFGVGDLYNLIVNQDQKHLTAADGVGPKLAARIVTELRDVVVKNAALRGENTAINLAPKSHHENDAVMALEQLGYSRNQAYQMIERAKQEQPQTAWVTSDLIRAALRFIGG